MSRWITPFVCACCTPSQTRAKSSSRLEIDIDRASQYSVMGSPFTSSITKYGRPVGVAPASSTFAIAG